MGTVLLPRDNLTGFPTKMRHQSFAFLQMEGWLWPANVLDEWTCQNMEKNGAGGTLDLQEQGWEFIQQLEFVVLSQEQTESIKSQR